LLVLKRIRFWGVYLIGLTIIVLMIWDLLFSGHGYFVYHGEEQKLEKLSQEIEQLQAEKEVLKSQILRLREDPKTLEEVIHRELGYVYPDEYMLIVPGSGQESTTPEQQQQPEEEVKNHE